MHRRRPEPRREATLERRAMKRRKCFWIVSAGDLPLGRPACKMRRSGRVLLVCVRVVVPARVRLLAAALGRAERKRCRGLGAWDHAAEERMEPELAVVA